MWFNKKHNIVVTGAKGQLGSYLVRELIKKSFKKYSDIGHVFGISRDDLDLSKPLDVSNFFNKDVIDPSVKIDYVIHCAAATDTAAVERDPLKHYASNVIASRNIAKSCAFNGIRMIHISTDYVLSELSPLECGNRIVEFPVNQYGMQKLMAEHEVQLAYLHTGHPERLLVGRASWLFGNSENSFVEKLLKGVFKTYVEAKKSGVAGKLKHNVVDDAYGRPTPVKLVLNRIVDAMHNKTCGIEDFQFIAHQISRHEWASMILMSFYNMLDKHFWPDIRDNAICEVVKDMQERIELNPVKSSCLNLGMRHPGLVAEAMQISANSKNAYDVYEKCTNDYIDANAKRLVNMMVEQLKDIS